MNVRYRVELSQIERDELVVMLGGGKHAKLKRVPVEVSFLWRNKEGAEHPGKPGTMRLDRKPTIEELA